MTFLQQILQIQPQLRRDSVEIYDTKEIVILKSKQLLDLSALPHYCYEFIMPFVEQPPLPEGKGGSAAIVKFAKDNRFMNGDSKEQNVLYYILILIEHNFMEQIAKQLMSGKQINRYQKCFSASSRIHYLVKMLIQELGNPQPGHELVLGSLGIQLVVQLLREASADVTVSDETLEQDHKNIHLAIDFLNRYYRDQFTLDQIARTANYSPFHFIRIFKAETGKTPFEYLLDLKINKAKELLRLSDSPITEICFLSGFNNLSHFTAVFKKKVGATPSVYRKQFQDNSH